MIKLFSDQSEVNALPLGCTGICFFLIVLDIEVVLSPPILISLDVPFIPDLRNNENLFAILATKDLDNQYLRAYTVCCFSG